MTNYDLIGRVLLIFDVKILFYSDINWRCKSCQVFEEVSVTETLLKKKVLVTSILSDKVTLESPGKALRDLEPMDNTVPPKRQTVDDSLSQIDFNQSLRTRYVAIQSLSFVSKMVKNFLNEI